MQTNEIMPLFWYSKPRDDQNWIRSRLAVMPDDVRREVCREYEDMFLNRVSRKEMNTWLNEKAKVYLKEAKTAPKQDQNIKNELTDRLERVKSEFGGKVERPKHYEPKRIRF